MRPRNAGCHCVIHTGRLIETRALLNFNVESDFVPTRSALMTGRHPIRTGALQSVPAGLPQGLIHAFLESLKEHPPVPPGAPDTFGPGAARRK